MFNVPVNSDDLSPEVVDLVSKIGQIQDTLLSVTFTAKELGAMGQALGGMKRAVTRGVRTAPDDQTAGQLVELLTEVSGLEKRIEGVVHDAFVDALGPDYASSPAAQQLDALIASQVAQPAPSDNTVADHHNAAYL